MKRIAIVSCDKWKNIIKEDILLRDSLISKRYLVDIISWEDTNVNYEKYDAMILRSVWGYHNNYSRFKEWIDMINKRDILLFNSPEIILNNIRKDKQFNILDSNNIEHIKTNFVYNLESLQNSIGKERLEVLKPIISGSGERTILIDNSRKNNFDIYEEVFKENDNGVMIQPFIEDISKGEISCIYINGINTHNMIRNPGIFTKKQRPYYIDNIPYQVKMLSDKVSKLDEFKDCLYLRVDIVMNNNRAYVMEVEAAEPDLLFKYINNEEIKEKGIDMLSTELVRRITK